MKLNNYTIFEFGLLYVKSGPRSSLNNFTILFSSSLSKTCPKINGTFSNGYSSLSFWSLGMLHISFKSLMYWLFKNTNHISLILIFKCENDYLRHLCQNSLWHLNFRVTLKHLSLRVQFCQIDHVNVSNH